jgi:hypothetical protein
MQKDRTWTAAPHKQVPEFIEISSDSGLGHEKTVIEVSSDEEAPVPHRDGAALDESPIRPWQKRIRLVSYVFPHTDSY